MSESAGNKKEGMNATVIVRSKEDGAGALSSNAALSEDLFKEYYKSGLKGQTVLQPPYLPDALRKAAEENNALQPCIDAMEVNVDGTGFEIAFEDGAGNEKDAEAISKGLFAECYPGVSFLTERRELRRDQEAVGYAYLEVIRNAQDEIVFLRRMEPDFTRMLSLDDPVVVRKSLNRNGKEIEQNVLVRERRFVQLVGNKTVFFKEFGATRDLDKDTGLWAEQGARLQATKRATEVLYFGNKKAAGTPYHVPRWVSQIPSVVGSRKAEELNLEFFDSGGIPPMVLLLAGGQLTEKSREYIERVFSGKAKEKLSAAIIEAISTGGSIEKDAPVSMSIESFGADAVKDSMFEGYDDKCEQRIRKSFRLPPLFVGKADDYSFATAFASYTVAEEQVFAPERFEFDSVMNATLMKDDSLGGGMYMYRSLPLTVNDIDTRLKGLTIATDKQAISNEELVEQLNALTGLNLQWNKKEDPAGELAALLAAATAPQGEEDPDDDDVDEVDEDGNPIQKADIDSVGLIDLSTRITKSLLGEAGATEAKTSIGLYKRLRKKDKNTVRVLVAKDLCINSADRSMLKMLDEEIHCAHG